MIYSFQTTYFPYQNLRLDKQKFGVQIGDASTLNQKVHHISKQIHELKRKQLLLSFFFSQFEVLFDVFWVRFLSNIIHIKTASGNQTKFNLSIRLEVKL